MKRRADTSQATPAGLAILRYTEATARNMAALAKLLGMHKSQLHEALHGHRPLTTGLIVRIASVLDVPLDTFADWYVLAKTTDQQAA